MPTERLFFGKLGSVYGRLNLISKPMFIFNCDETGVSIVHKPGKVIAELGRRNVYAVTSAERGKTHGAFMCFSIGICFATNDDISKEKMCARKDEGRCCSRYFV